MPLLHIWLICAQIDPSSASPVRQAVILVQEKAFTLASLPRSSAEGRQRGSQVVKDLLRDLQSLDEALKGLPLQAPAPGKLVVAPVHLPEAKELLAFLTDEEFKRLEVNLRDALQSWEVAMSSADSQGVSNQKSPSPVPSQEGQGKASKAETSGKDRPAPSPFHARLDASAYGTTDEAREAHERGADPRKRDPDTQREWENQQTNIRKNAMALGIADQQLPKVIPHWNALTAHLERRARKASDLVDNASSATDPGILELRRRVRVKFLAQLRFTLTTCREIWLAFLTFSP